MSVRTGLTRVVLLVVVVLLPRAASAQGPIWVLDFVSSGSASATVRSQAVLTARVRLSGSSAPAGGFTLTLTTSVPRVLSMPASVTVPAGRSEALFEIRAAAVSTSIRIDVRATGGGRTQAAIVTVTPVSASAQMGMNTPGGGAPGSAGAGSPSSAARSGLSAGGSGAPGVGGAAPPGAKSTGPGSAAAPGAASAGVGSVAGGVAAAQGGAASAASTEVGSVAGGVSAVQGSAAGAASTGVGAVAAGAAAAGGGMASGAAGAAGGAASGGVGSAAEGAAAAQGGAAGGAAAAQGGAAGGVAAAQGGAVAAQRGAAGGAPTSAALSVLVAPPNAVAGQVASFVIQARTQSNGRRTTGGDAFVARLSGPQAAAVSIKDAGDGTYVGSFVVNTTGTYTLHVLLAGVPVSGSPFAVSVK